MATFHFELASPERLVFSGEVDQVDVPGSEGDFGVLAGHAPLVTMLLTWIFDGEKPTRRATIGGVLAVLGAAGLKYFSVAK